MTVDGNSERSWGNIEAYGLAAICLVLGIAAGYLIHGPQRLATSAAITPQQTAHASPDGGTAQNMPEALKHMALKQAEPLVAKLAKNPNDADLLAQIGKTYLMAHQFESATEYYERSAKIKPEVRTLTTLGGAYHLAGDDAKALDAWKRALAIDPNSADALFNYGLVKWQFESDSNAAITAWEKLLKSNPNHPQRAHVEDMIARAKKHAVLPVEAKAK